MCVSCFALPVLFLIYVMLALVDEIPRFGRELNILLSITRYYVGFFGGFPLPLSAKDDRSILCYCIVALPVPFI